MATDPLDGRVVGSCGLACRTSRRAFLGRIPGVVLAAMVAGDAATAEAFYVVGEVVGVEAGASQMVYPLPAADGVTIDKPAQVILVRFQGKVMAFNLACPHENNALRWLQAAGRFQCPKHESKYSPDGTFTGGRATRNMDRLPIARSGNTVIVTLSRIVKSDTEAAEWASAMVIV